MNPNFMPHLWSTFLVGLCIHCLFSLAASQGTNNSVVRGTVSDILGAVVPNATVSFENEGKVYSAVTSQDGDYSIALPSAIYRVSVDANRSGFERLRRSPIRLEPRLTRTLNVQVTTKLPVLGRYYDVPTKQVIDHPSIQLFGYTYEDIRGISELGVDRATVSFGTRCESSTSISFTASPFQVSDGARVTLTYDFLTITSKEVRFNKEKRAITVCGDVAIELDHDKQAFNNCVNLNIKDGKAWYSELK